MKTNTVYFVERNVVKEMKMGKMISLVCAGTLAVTALTACSTKTDSSSSQKESTSSYYNATAVNTGWEWGNVEIVGGGFVPNIVYNPTEKGLAYARTDIGGAYKLNSKTNRWECITDFIGGDDWNYMGIESIATDPVEPNRVYIAAGTYSNSKGAIFYSDDYGKNWGKCGLSFGCGGNEVGRGCGERLQVDPNDNSIIYFSSRADGLWKSTDYGKSFKQVTQFPTKGGYIEDGYSIGLTFVAFDKNSSKKGTATKTIIVGAAATKGDYIYRSDDAGKTWKSIKNPTAKTTKDDTERLKPCQGEISSDGYLYSTWSYKVGPNNATVGAVQKLDLKTNKWTEVTPNTEDTCGYNGISVNPKNPNMIVCTTLDLWAYVDNVYVSYDAGKTWRGIWNYDDKGNEVKNYKLDISNAKWLDWQNQLKPGWWMTGVAINPFNADEIMYGTGATIFGTTNLSKIATEPVNINVRAMGIEETAIMGFVSPKGENAPDLYSIMGDVYGFRHDDATVAPSEHYGDFKATSIDCAANNTDYVVRATQDDESTVVYSTDGAKTWKAVATLPDGVDEKAGGSVKLSADGKTLFYQGGTASTNSYITTNWGKTWTKCKGIPGSCTIESDKVNPKKLYAAYDGKIFMSTDGGKNFSSCAELLISNFTMTACPDKEGDLWLGIGGGGVYYVNTSTGEMEATSKQITECDALGLGKAEKDGDYMALYMLGEANGKGYGVYQSTDKGKTWKRINDDTQKWGNVNKMISGDPKTYGRVYIGTNGRGIIMGNVKKN